MEHDLEFQRLVMGELSSSRRPMILSLRQLDYVVASSIGAEATHCVAVDCRTGFYDTKHPQGKHIGLYPEIVERFVQCKQFQTWLLKFLDNLVEMTAADQSTAYGTFGRGIYHIGCWCNRGPAVSSIPKLIYTSRN
jgi:hypothetical protein